ncbi:right-handed parallel beta-helix repeat-containing protein [Verrucomicrobiaceae bacterium N1E253]|uniref:Right-handed parallel beta-helix repeat-containing protein n=1 Tax=Oceaniferula marina TaxID=2748318 RepID=A0A851GQF7_9BACT|nr:right-handed parallel beta-helix repeat-containing protein [Oceaniferula marina]NWK57345.1 right-handed parallel beta-helix repeat-containing protein [Oceaniferula marina]
MVLSLCLSAAAKEVYVSPTGDDLNTGTHTEPLKTLHAARDHVRKSRKTSSGKKTPNPATIYLLPGDYYLHETLRFDERDSMLTIKPANKQHQTATLHGGVKVTGWTRWKGDIFRAKSPVTDGFRRLIVNGIGAVQARHPNVGDGFGGGLKRVNNTTIAVPAAWKEYDYSRAQVFGWLGPNWFSEVRSAQAFDKTRLQLKISSGSKMYRGINHRIYIQGVPELLDEPGEWCHSPKDGYIYYWPTDKEDPNTKIVVATTRERILDIRGSSPKKTIHDFALENLHFAGSNFSDEWWIFDRKKVPNGAMPEALQEGLIYGENIRGLSVKHCKITGAGHSAIYLNKWAQNCHVYGCWIQDAGFAGVYMNGYSIGRGPFKSAKESYINKGHRIENNFIYDCGKFIGSGCGIQFYQSGDNQVLHNRISYMPRYGISYKGNRFGVIPEQVYGEKKTFENHWDFVHSRNNRIAYNDISNVCLDSFDFGGIEAWGPGRDNVWEYNAIHDIAQAVKWDGWAHGLFTDDACHYHTLRGNIIYALHGGKLTGAVMVKSCYQTVENNIIAASDIGRAFSLTPYLEPAVNMVVRNNIVDGPTRSLHDYRPASFKQMHTVKDPTGSMDAYLKNQPVYKEVDRQIVWPAPKNLKELQAVGWEKNIIVADPGFQTRPAFSALSHSSFALDSNSAAVKAGFKPIPVDQIGLRSDFSFDRTQMERIEPNTKMQAENATRIFKVRPVASHYVTPTQPDAWIKFANVDFKDGSITKCSIGWVKDKNTKDKPQDDFSTCIRRWELAGPFTEKGKTAEQLFDIAFAPEQNKQPKWNSITGGEINRGGESRPPGWLDFLQLFEGKYEHAVAYVKTEIPSDKARKVRLNLGSDDGVKVWVNGKLVISHMCKRGMRLGDESVVLDLQKGQNTILMKIIQATQNWMACAEILDLETGEPYPNKSTSEQTHLSNKKSSLEIRAGSPSGPILAVATNDQTSAPLLKKLKGTHDLFVVFKEKVPLSWIRMDK